MLEACRVGGVSCDGYIYALMPHDGNAFAYIVGAVAFDLCARTVAVGDFTDDVELACEIVELGLHICEAVDAGDDLCGIFSEAVEDAAERLLAHLVSLCGNLDGALCGCERLVAGEEGETFCLFAEETGGEVAVAESDLTVISH